MDNMSARPKLMTRGKFALCMAAVIAGTSLQPIREYRQAGTISTLTVVIAAITFCIGLAIVFAVGWWANRPECGGSNE
jgi:uncharacterized membrane protein